ncbi:MAG: hypothetical protein IKE43_09060 [Coriobacteriales bacterium]|nr:hypothetical protein [Coriobacteriales bacterium]
MKKHQSIGVSVLAALLLMLGLTACVSTDNGTPVDQNTTVAVSENDSVQTPAQNDEPAPQGSNALDIAKDAQTANAQKEDTPKEEPAAAEESSATEAPVSADAPEQEEPAETNASSEEAAGVNTSDEKDVASAENTGEEATVPAGSAGKEDTEETDAKPLPQKPFKSTQPRDAAELDALVDQAIALAAWRAEHTPQEDQGVLMDSSFSHFSDANKAYRSGDYRKAAQLYAQVLEVYPMHYGASVNIVPTYMQLELNDDAVIQAFSCLIQFPTEAGAMLNAQAAATAAGFAESDIENYLRDVANYATLAGYGSAGEYWDAVYGDTLRSSFDYNSVWNRIETQMVDTTQPPETYDRTEYDALVAELNRLEEQTPRDPEVTQLHAYLEVAGVQLGFEAE